MSMFGRRVIYTDENSITINNIAKVVAETLPIHEQNRAEMQTLFDYCRGDQPGLYREKPIRKEINIHANINYAKEIVDFKDGYEFANPITLIQRAKRDFKSMFPGLAKTFDALGVETEKYSATDDARIAVLNEMYAEQNKAAKDLEVAHDFHVCGLGYMIAYPKKYRTDDVAPFDLLVLNPLNTYVVRTNDMYQRKILSVTYSIPKNGGAKRFTAYTDDSIFTSSNGFEWREIRNIIGINPIVEFTNNDERLGCFETVIPLMDALNIMNSDRVNDVAQYVQSILWLNNAKISDDQTEELRNGGFIQTKTTSDGHDVKLAYITAPLDQSGTQSAVDYMHSQILEVCGVPGRERSTGGNTGSAILLSSGWQIAETHAKAMEIQYSDPARELNRIVLAIINNTNEMPEELKTLRLSDILIKFSRNKSYDLVSRATAAATLIRTGYDIEATTAVCDIYDDSHQVAIDSASRIDKLLFESGNKMEEVKIQSGNVVGGARSAEDYNVPVAETDERYN